MKITGMAVIGIVATVGLGLGVVAANIQPEQATAELGVVQDDGTLICSTDEEPNTDGTACTPHNIGTYECPEGFVAGWLDEHGQPTGCVNNGPACEELGLVVNAAGECVELAPEPEPTRIVELTLDTPDPRSATPPANEPTPEPCYEDMTCWDWRTMGNQTAGGTLDVAGESIPGLVTANADDTFTFTPNE